MCLFISLYNLYKNYFSSKKNTNTNENSNCTISRNNDSRTNSPKGCYFVNESKIEEKWYHNLKYLFIGIAFGIVFVKAEIISWFRI